MSRLVSGWIKSLLLFALLFLGATNCAKLAIDQNVPAIQQSGTTSKCRVIQHERGETCVPLNPQRIVVSDSNAALDPIVALGIKPVGFTSIDLQRPEVVRGLSLDDLQGAVNVGFADQPSLEKVLMLKPDLILASKTDPYPLLSEIAPTVFIPYPNSDQPNDQAFFKQTLRYIAKIVDKEAKAEELINQYQKRIEDFQHRLGNQRQQIEVVVIYHSPGLIYTPARNYDATADVLTDTGLRYKLPTAGVPFSIESFDEYNTDVLFMISNERKPLSYYSQHPLFKHLKAVKTNRLYLVPPERWDTRGILGANQILDDLFQYLLQNE
jgi:iron complex transport system substrate-binding protein